MLAKLELRYTSAQPDELNYTNYTNTFLTSGN